MAPPGVTCPNSPVGFYKLFLNPVGHSNRRSSIIPAWPSEEGRFYMLYHLTLPHDTPFPDGSSTGASFWLHPVALLTVGSVMLLPG